MSVIIPTGKREVKANPTISTQEKILEVIRNEENPISLTEISKRSNTSFYQTKFSIEFLSSLGIVKLIHTSNNQTYVVLNKQGDGNEKH